MPDADTYAQLVARHGPGRVASAVLARWMLDPEADDRRTVLEDDLERMQLAILGVSCPTCGVDFGTPCQEVYGTDAHTERITEALRRGLF